MATYGFLQHGMIDSERNKRTSKKALLTWNDLEEYFNDAIDNDARLVIETETRKGSEFPLEARMLVKNAICPLGKRPDTDKNIVSVPCKSEQQGKKQLIEFVNAFSNDKSIQTTIAQWLASRKKMAFDRDTIPQELLDSA